MEDTGGEHCNILREYTNGGTDSGVLEDGGAYACLEPGRPCHFRGSINIQIKCLD